MSSLDYLDLCRLCLVKDRVSVPIFDGEGDVRQIFLKIAACLPVKVAREDKLPKKICGDCVYKVELLYQFWNTTANAEKQLLQWLGEVGLEDKQGYVTGVLNPSIMKQEDSSPVGLAGGTIQVSGTQPNIGIGVIDNMGLGMPLIIPGGNDQQLTSVSMETNVGTIQPVHQAVPGPSNPSGTDPLSQSQTNTSTRHQEDEEETSEEEENSDDDCDGDDGLPVKEESEEDPSNSRTIEPTTFVNVSLACDEAGPSGLQQQKIAEIPELSMPQNVDGDAKSGIDAWRHKSKAPLTIKEEPGLESNPEKNQPPVLTNGLGELYVVIHSTEKDPLAPIPLSEPIFAGLYYTMSDTNEGSSTGVEPVNGSAGALVRNSDPVPVTIEVSDAQRYAERLKIVQEEANAAKMQCKPCNKVFHHRSNYKKHMRRHAAPNLPCKHCPRKFRFIRDVTRHEKTHFHPSFSCEVCDYDTIVATDLTIHMLKHTENTEPPFKCSDCDKRFRKAHELQEHYNIHSGEKPFVCTTCGRAFFLRRQLAAHTRQAHPESKPAKDTNTECDICGRVLATRRSLYRHKKSHTATKPFLCDYCGKSLSTQEHLKKHRRIHTGERPFVCDICGKGFTDSENLRMHRRIHTGEKPYKCDQCPKAFSQRSTLTIHRRGHTGERPYVCKLCHRGFSCQGNLTAHQKSTCI